MCCCWFSYWLFRRVNRSSTKKKNYLRKRQRKSCTSNDLSSIFNEFDYLFVVVAARAVFSVAISLCIFTLNRWWMLNENTFQCYEREKQCDRETSMSFIYVFYACPESVAAVSDVGVIVICFLYARRVLKKT